MAYVASVFENKHTVVMFNEFLFSLGGFGPLTNFACRGCIRRCSIFDPNFGKTNKMIFLTSELANKAEIAILSARDTTRAWVPGRGIMGRNVGVYKKGYNTWLSSRPQNQPRSFRRSFCLIFPLLCA